MQDSSNFKISLSLPWWAKYVVTQLQEVFKNLEQFILRCVRCNGVSRTQFEPIDSPTLPIIEVKARSVSNIHLSGRGSDPNRGV